MRTEKACPRCGGTGYDPRFASGRCKTMPTAADRTKYNRLRTGSDDLLNAKVLNAYRNSRSWTATARRFDTSINIVKRRVRDASIAEHRST